MVWAARRFDASLAVLVSISLAAWSVLALRWSEVTPAAFCSTGLQLDSTSLLSGWLLMLAAMMPPLVAGPLRHVRERSFASRRVRAMSLFVIGYAAVWMIAGMGLQLMAFAAQWATSDARLCFVLSASAAMLWQVSPAKQWF